jgi:glycosyltransferase involved in cell wall biosynthesis
MSARVDLPLLTVMMPVRNEERYIEQTLKQIHAQTYPHDRMEVLVTDGLSTDATADIVRHFAATHADLAVRLIHNPKRLSSAGRNLAVQNGRGDYFLLIDGHVHIPSRDLLHDMVLLALKHGARVLGRPQPLSPPDISFFQSMVALARHSPLAHSQESFIYSEYEGWTSPISIGVMYRRDVFEEIGRFDEGFDAAEDLEFNYRIERRGIQCFTSPRFAVHYYPRDSFIGLCRQMRRYGYGRAAFAIKHPERIRIETIVPAGFVAVNVTLLVLGVFWPKVLALFGLFLTIYILILVAEGVRLARHRGVEFTVLLPAIIACVHTGLGLGFLGGVARWPVRLVGKYLRA